MSYSYTIADMSLWGWSRMVPFILGENAWEKFPHLKRHHDDIGKRPAAIRALRFGMLILSRRELDEEALTHSVQASGAELAFGKGRAKATSYPRPALLPSNTCIYDCQRSLRPQLQLNLSSCSRNSIPI